MKNFDKWRKYLKEYSSLPQPKHPTYPEAPSLPSSGGGPIAIARCEAFFEKMLLKRKQQVDLAIDFLKVLDQAAKNSESFDPDFLETLDEGKWNDLLQFGKPKQVFAIVYKRKGEEREYNKKFKSREEAQAVADKIPNSFVIRVNDYVNESDDDDDDDDDDDTDFGLSRHGYDDEIKSTLSAFNTDRRAGSIASPYSKRQVKSITNAWIGKKEIPYILLDEEEFRNLPHFAELNLNKNENSLMYEYFWKMLLNHLKSQASAKEIENAKKKIKAKIEKLKEKHPEWESIDKVAARVEKLEADLKNVTPRGQKGPGGIALSKPEMLNMAKMFEDYKGWYSELDENEYLRSSLGEDFDTFKVMLGITSQRASVENNFQNACIVMEFYYTYGEYPFKEVVDNNWAEKTKGKVAKFFDKEGNLKTHKGIHFLQGLAAKKGPNDYQEKCPDITSEWTDPTVPPFLEKMYGMGYTGAMGLQLLLFQFIKMHDGSVDMDKLNPDELRDMGPKIGSFILNLLGDTEEVTVDLWMFRLFFGDDKNLNSKTHQKAIRSYVSDMAKTLDWEPREVQAAVWIAMKSVWPAVLATAKTQKKDFTHDFLLSKGVPSDYRPVSTYIEALEMHSQALERMLRAKKG